MAWGRNSTSRALRARGFIILWAAFSGTPLIGKAQSVPDAPPFSLSPQALYAAASAPRTPEGTNVSVLDLRETYAFEADGSNHYTQYFVYKILSAEGAESWNAMYMGWSPWREDKPAMKARVILADGTTYSLDQATITDSPARVTDSSIYSDARTVRAPLPAIAPGAVVEYEITMKERLPFVGAGKVGRSFFQMSEPVQRRRLTLQAPKSLSLRYRVDLLPGMTPAVTQDNDVSRWVFESGPTVAAEPQTPGLPSDVYEYPLVTFSTGSSWQELAQAYHKIVAERLAEANVNDLVARLTKNRTSREAKVSAIVEYLNREVRYTGIEFDQASVFPTSTAKILSRKFGDCKDKSLLLVAMLRAAGIQANLALLNAGDRLDVPAELPGMGLFDHAIVYVPGEPAYWIDATDETARLGQLPDADRGRLALIIDTTSTALTRVEEARSADNVIYEEREIRLKDEGPAHVVEISKPRGNYESDYRRVYVDVNNKDTKESLTDYVKAEYLAERLDKLDRSDPKDFSQPFRLTLESARAERAQTSLSEAVAYIRIEGLFNSLPRDLRTREPSEEENAKATRPAKKRVADYALKRPFVSEWHYRIVPPPGFVAAALPSNATIDVGPTRFIQQFSMDADGAVRADLKFDTVKRRFTAAEYSTVRNKVAELLEGEPVKIKFDLKASLLLAQGQAKESFQAYRELIKKHPKDAIQHLRRADGLLKAGMGEAARAEAAVAIKLDPKSAFAQETLAEILQHDLIGRWHAPGADYAGAAAAYRAAIALDPDDKSLVANYAILLEHNARGMRYGTGANLKEAIAQYRKLTANQIAELDVATNLPYALFYARDFEGALQAANALEDPPLQLVAACEALLKGVSQAMEQVRRRAENDARYKEVLSTAGQMLMHLREYPAAASFLEAGASGANTARMMALVSVLRQAKRHEDIKFANTPEDLVRRVLIETMKGPPSLDVLHPFESRLARLDRQALTPSEIDERLQTLHAALLNAARAGLSPEELIDITLQALQLKITGDDTLGYRALMQMPGAANDAFFIVKENGEFKVLDSAARPTALALEALERLERQDLAGASMLFAWLREVKQAKSTEDPFEGDPFVRLWPQGQRQADARGIKLAAASLLVQMAHSARRGVEILEQIKTAGASDAELENIDHALLLGYEKLRDRERAIAAAVALEKRKPGSRRLFHARSHQLRALGRFKEAEELAQQRLKSLPDDIDALRVISETSAAQRHYAVAYEQGLKVLANGSSGAMDLNQQAWLSLFFERAGGPDVDTAVKAVQHREAGSAILHTLGCLYAEVGKTREAREVLLQAMEARNLTQPDSEFWYAFARIAEQYGESEVALANYSKVKPPKDAALEYISTYQLAQNRMKVLGGKAAPAR